MAAINLPEYLNVALQVGRFDLAFLRSSIEHPSAYMSPIHLKILGLAIRRLEAEKAQEQ